MFDGAKAHGCVSVFSKHGEEGFGPGVAVFHGHAPCRLAFDQSLPSSSRLSLGGLQRRATRDFLPDQDASDVLGAEAIAAPDFAETCTVAIGASDLSVSRAGRLHFSYICQDRIPKGLNWLGPLKSEGPAPAGPSTV